MRCDGYCRAQTTCRFLFPLPPLTSGRSVASETFKITTITCETRCQYFSFFSPRTISYEVASDVYGVRIYTSVAVDEIASIIYYNVMRIELDVCADSKILLCIFQRLIINIIVPFEIQNNNTRPARFQ